MKNAMLLIILGTFVGISAQAKSFTDFDKTLIKYRLSGYSTPEQAQSASVASLNDILNGILPTKTMIQSNDEDCKDVNNFWSKKDISKYIKKRGKYSGVRAHGFKLSESFDSQGNAVYSSWVRATIPCLKKD